MGTGETYAAGTLIQKELTCSSIDAEFSSKTA